MESSSRVEWSRAAEWSSRAADQRCTTRRTIRQRSNRAATEQRQETSRQVSDHDPRRRGSDGSVTEQRLTSRQTSDGPVRDQRRTNRQRSGRTNDRKAADQQKDEETDERCTRDRSTADQRRVSDEQTDERQRNRQTSDAQPMHEQIWTNGQVSNG